jgi:PAS domain S-box-containing protein
MEASLNIYSPEVTEQLLENSQKSILFIQADGTISYSNNVTLKFFGFKSSDLVGKNLFHVLADWVEQHEVVLTAIKDGKTDIDEIVLTRKNKSKFIGQIRLFRLFDDAKQVAGTILIVTDLNKRIAFRESLTQKISTLEALTKSRFIRDGNLDKAIYEILEQSAKTLNVERANAWLIDKDFTCIESIGNYNSKTQSLQPQEKLLQKDLPAYFKLLQTEEIIVLNDALHDKRSFELVENYLITNNISSMMDVPIRIEGEMVGVVCFENTGKSTREWDLIEQKFGLFVAQLISLSLETHTKQQVKLSLEESLREKEVLLSEIHHRVKNNLSIISSLINLQATKAKDSFHTILFDESKNMVHTIAEIHHLLYESNNFSHINFKDYLEKIINLIQQSYESKSTPVKLIKDLTEVYLTMEKAIPCGLIVNELITNSYKHAFKSNRNAQINVSMHQHGDTAELIISDNGIGMESFTVNEKSLGISIVQDLAKQITAQISFSNRSGSKIVITFPNPA